MSTGGKFVVHTARWGINSLPDAEWVGRRVDGTNWFGRYKKGRLIEKSYPGALAGQEWIAKTLKATGKVEEDGLDGKA